MIGVNCTCGSSLADKELVYKNYLKKLCIEMNVDYNDARKGVILDNNKEFIEKRAKIILSITDPDNYCCRQQILNSIDTFELFNKN